MVQPSKAIRSIPKLLASDPEGKTALIDKNLNGAGEHSKCSTATALELSQKSGLASGSIANSAGEKREGGKWKETRWLILVWE